MPTAPLSPEENPQYFSELSGVRLLDADDIYINPEGSPIKQTLEILSRRRYYYEFFRAYFLGRHRLLFQTSKFRSLFRDLFRGFADNLLPIVIDTYSDRLRLKQFDVLKGGGKALTKELQQIWTERRLDQTASEVHTEALIAGDAYVIVWPNAEGEAVIYPQRAEECLVARDPDSPEIILWATKIWRAGNRFRLNIYWPDRVEKYATPESTQDNVAWPQSETAFTPFEDEGGAVIPNDFGRVPVFHFANNSRCGGFGSSELAPLIALQDALNKSCVDMLVAAEFMALPQRWASGIEVSFDDNGAPIAPFQPGIDRVWIAAHPEARFGQFDPANLSTYVEIQEAFRREIARISGIPMYYLLQTGQFPSGDALRMAEARLISRCQRKQGVFGNSWESLIEFALRIEGKGGADLVLSAAWEFPAPVQPDQTIETLLLKQQIGVPRKTLLLEAGYGAEVVDQMLAEQDAQAANLGALMQGRFDSGRIN